MSSRQDQPSQSNAKSKHTRSTTKNFIADDAYQFERHLSPESFDLISALNQQQFFSPYHEGVITILGNDIIRNGVVIDRITEDSIVELLWSEYLYQLNRNDSDSSGGGS